MALSSTYAVRLGSIVAGIAWIVLLVAPGSRADDSPGSEAVGVSAQAGSDASSTTTSVPPSTVVATTVAPTSVGPTTAPTTAPKVAPTTAKPGTPTTTVRVFSVRDLVGVSIDRGATWIAIATVTIVDQTGTPAADVEVKATWSFENTGASCRSDTTGKCSMYRSGLPANVDSATITITAPQNAAKTIRREGVN